MDDQIIFDSDDIVVHFHKGSSDFLVITFIGIGHEESASTLYFGKPVFQKYDISCIGITTRQRNWYYSPNMHKALEVIWRYSAGYRKTIAIGLSAGAYAAIKYSMVLKTDVTIALAPQLSIDDRETGVIPEWAALCTSSMRGMGIKREDISGDIFILHDRHHKDDRQAAETILSYTLGRSDVVVALVNIPSAGHIVYESLKGSKNLMALIETASSTLPVRERQALLAQQTRAFRRENAVNVYNRIRAGFERHPLLTWQLLASRRFADVRKIDDILNDETVFYRLAAILNNRGYTHQARTLLRAMICYHTTEDFRLYSLKDEPFIEGRPVFLDHRGRTLGYSLKRRQFTSSNIVWMEGDAVPVSSIEYDGIVYPTVSYLGKNFFPEKQEGWISLAATPGNLSVVKQGKCSGIRAEDGTFVSIVGDFVSGWTRECLSYETFSGILL
ncbi:hypothetical protein [Acetobacter sp.]|jgi:hypothetical protein|uniref:hypothetical protein n=1 Tax=Acetobacter sp. TaxID=440 RepID=UPI0025C48A60|nr:hypothetical protein [Acetobacter sp.]MCH4092404.1 hypothetical protein [Acetobacter sp.]MCI1299537.1 hypothetical protein [Acetobacter sp.]MCI1315583.1 hypothetical protein [Acetobacter sp.]